MKKTPYIACIVLLILFLNQCRKTDLIRSSSMNNLKALQDTIKYKENALGTITASKKALEVTERELRNEVYIKDERINKLTKDFNTLKSVSSVKQEIKYEVIEVPYIDSVPCVFSKKIQLDEEWYSLEVLSNQKGITINNMTIPNEQILITGFKKDGIFKPKYLTVDVVNTNPNIKVIDMHTQVVPVKTEFYNKLWFRIAEVLAGIGLGVYISR